MPAKRNVTSPISLQTRSRSH